MKANVKKPIQSLHSFWCHLSGGSIAALPSIYFFVFVTGGLLLCTTPLAAQQDDSNKQHTEEKRLDLLYDKIMQNMTSEVRERFDSASTSHAAHKTPVSRPNVTSDVPYTSLQSDVQLKARLHELPDNLKVQVERAITDMQKRKEERKAQFRESRNNR